MTDRVEQFRNTDGGFDIYRVPDPWPGCPECNDPADITWVDVTCWGQFPDREFVPGYTRCLRRHEPEPPRSRR